MLQQRRASRPGRPQLVDLHGVCGRELLAFGRRRLEDRASAKVEEGAGRQSCGGGVHRRRTFGGESNSKRLRRGQEKLPRSRRHAFCMQTRVHGVAQNQHGALGEPCLVRKNIERAVDLHIGWGVRKPQARAGYVRVPTFFQSFSLTSSRLTLSCGDCRVAGSGALPSTPR